MAYATEAMQGGLSAGTALAIGGQGASVAAAGSAITDATVVKASISIVTAADGTKGVKLVGSIGDEVWLFNNSGSTLLVYGDASTVAISVAGTGLGSAGTAFSQLTYKATSYKKQSATQWFAVTSA